MPGFYSPQLTPSTPSAPSISYAYPASSSSQTSGQGSSALPHFNLGSGRNYNGGPIRMAQSGASTPVPTSPVQGPLARSSSMMDFGSYGQSTSQSQGQGQGSAGGQAGRWGGGFGFGLGMNTGQGAGSVGGSSPIDLKGANGKRLESPPPTAAHPSSFDPSPAQLGIGSSSSSGSHGDPGGSGDNDGVLAMSISPPSWGSWGHYQPANGSGSYGASMGGNAYMGSWGGIGAGSFVGSLGQMGQSFGRERDRELEARYTKDFSCCGRQLNGLHELLEHYEEEHANLSPDARFAALSAAQAPPGHPRPSFTMPNPAVSSVQPPLPRGLRSPSGGQDDAPAPPGMMDIEMDDDASGSNTSSTTTRQPVLNGGMGYVSGVSGGFGGGFGVQPSAVQHSPWASAFKPIYPGTTGIPPSLLTMPASGMSGLNQAQGGQGGGQQATLQNPQVLQHQLQQNQLRSASPQQAFSRPITPLPSGFASLPPSAAPSRASTPLPSSKQPLSAEEVEARAARKAQRKAERAKKAAEEDGSGDDAGPTAGEEQKKFPCPIEGCGKVYKQANGLKYHLTRSINSGHGNVAEMGLPAGALPAG